MHGDQAEDTFGVGEPAPILIRGLGIGRRPWDFGGGLAGLITDDPHEGTFTAARAPRRKVGRKPRRATASPERGEAD